MKLGLLVTTYNRENALDLVLESVRHQTRLPDEVVIGDDGSGPATQQLIQRHAEAAPFPIRHVWQEDLGFRPARARNRAIAAASADYLVMIDGDMVLHPEFLADHVREARPNRYVQAGRCFLDERTTERALRDGHVDPERLDPGHASPLRFRTRVPALTRLWRWLPVRSVPYQACNQGFWREHLVRANGFDERMFGWGREDDELCARLQHMGVRRRTVVFAALAFHLHHEQAPLDRLEENHRILLETRRLKRTRAPVGLDAHL